MKKISAFTIMEMTLALLISSVVIGAAWTAMDIVQRQAFGFQDSGQETICITRFDSWLRNDIDQAQTLLAANDYLFLEHPLGDIQYIFFDEKVIRIKGDRTDTFQLQLNELDASFQGNNLSGVSSWADRIELQIAQERVIHTFLYHKAYGADFLMQIEEHEH